MLKNNNYVYLNFSTATHGRAKSVVTEIIDGMSNNDNGKVVSGIHGPKSFSFV